MHGRAAGCRSASTSMSASGPTARTAGSSSTARGRGSLRPARPHNARKRARRAPLVRVTPVLITRDGGGSSMKGLICAGGHTTRLQELTRVLNKHLLPVGHWPMIYYPLQQLQRLGVEEGLLVTGQQHGGQFIDLL